MYRCVCVPLFGYQLTMSFSPSPPLSPSQILTTHALEEADLGEAQAISLFSCRICRRNIMVHVLIDVHSQYFSVCIADMPRSIKLQLNSVLNRLIFTRLATASQRPFLEECGDNCVCSTCIHYSLIVESVSGKGWSILSLISQLAIDNCKEL